MMSQAKPRLGVAAVAMVLVCCGDAGYNPTGPTVTLLYTGNVGGNLEPCG